MDLAPEFPKLTKFLDYWERNLDGKLHTVMIADASVVGRKEIRYAGHELRLH